MSYTKKIVCLANSWRDGERCVAGREITDEGTFGDWIRPVSRSPSRDELTEHERQYKNGIEPRLLDVVDIEFLNPKPEKHQKENHVISGKRWERKRRLSWDCIQDVVENPKTLWVSNPSGGRDKNDRVLSGQIARLKNSLYLIQPDVLKIVRSGRSYRAEFRFNDIDYDLSITAPEVKNIAASSSDMSIHSPLLCVSLAADPQFNHRDGMWCFYKLVAAVITPDIDDE